MQLSTVSHVYSNHVIMFVTLSEARFIECTHIMSVAVTIRRRNANKPATFHPFNDVEGSWRIVLAVEAAKELSITAVESAIEGSAPKE